MIITRAMSTQQTAITGVLRRITAGQEIKAGLCRGPGLRPPPAQVSGRPGVSWSVLGFDQSIQILSDLVDQQPTRAVRDIPDSGPGERPRASTRREGITEQHQYLRRGVAGQFSVTRMPDQALHRTVLGSRGDGETASTGVVLRRTADHLVSTQPVPDELRVTQVTQAGRARKFQMGQQLSAEVTLINDAAAALVHLVENRLQ